jgi:hypothetical protein
MTCSYEGAELLVGDGRRVHFDFPILEVAERSGVCIVVLNIPPKVSMTENVYGVSGEGIILWQIERSEKSGHDPTCCYVGFVPCDVPRAVRIANWSCWVADVDVRSGTILSEYFAK